MDTTVIAKIFSAAGNPTRLNALRLLASEPDGLPAGEIAERLDVVQNTMSAHLKTLAAASLVVVDRAGRTLVYRLNRAIISAVTADLSKSLDT